MGWIGGHGHFVQDQCCPPHGLLFGDGWYGADAGADEADEGDRGMVMFDDVANVGLIGGRVGWRDPVEVLLVAGTLYDAVGFDILVLQPSPVFSIRSGFKDYFTVLVHGRGKGAGIHPSIRVCIFRRIEVLVAHEL